MGRDERNDWESDIKVIKPSKITLNKVDFISK